MKASEAAEMALLERLPQTAAAYLLGVTPRGLRDMDDAPRNHDGTYNAQALVLYARLRVRDDRPIGGRKSSQLKPRLK